MANHIEVFPSCSNLACIGTFVYVIQPPACQLHTKAMRVENLFWLLTGSFLCTSISEVNHPSAALRIISRTILTISECPNISAVLSRIYTSNEVPEDAVPEPDSQSAIPATLLRVGSAYLIRNLKFEKMTPCSKETITDLRNEFHCRMHSGKTIHLRNSVHTKSQSHLKAYKIRESSYTALPRICFGQRFRSQNTLPLNS